VELPMEKQKIVALLEDIYIAESMAEGVGIEIKDSIKSVYLKQVAKNHNMSIEKIDQVLNRLSEIPDSLYAFQGIALDSLRNKQLKIKEKVNIGR
jgi:ferritin-like metal-binding protein YciE